MQRYLFPIGGGLPQEHDEFEAMFHGLQVAWADDSSQLVPYQTWKDEALKRYSGDEQLLSLLQKEST